LNFFGLFPQLLYQPGILNFFFALAVVQIANATRRQPYSGLFAGLKNADTCQGIGQEKQEPPPAVSPSENQPGSDNITHHQRYQPKGQTLALPFCTNINRRKLLF
jgi:hypothetical protein